jgi:hypothetical protein
VTVCGRVKCAGIDGFDGHLGFQVDSTAEASEADAVARTREAAEQRVVNR